MALLFALSEGGGSLFTVFAEARNEFVQRGR